MSKPNNLNKRKKLSSIRIIGGCWRGRKVSFVTCPKLRPTSDRVRETLFNWIKFYLPGATCLDLFAGSGVLGFEALSHGASSVTLVDMDAIFIEQLQQTKQQLLADDANIVHSDVLTWLERPKTRANIVFIDPPYHSKLIQQVLHLLHDKQWLQDMAYIYFEHDQEITTEQLPASWEILRSKKAGRVYYYLVTNVSQLR